MGDNAFFIHQRLLAEGTEKQKANQLFTDFEGLLARSRQSLNAGQITQLNREALSAAQQFRVLLLAILKSQVTQGITIFFKPDFLNIMVSMADMYIYLLNSFLSGRQPEFIPISQDLFWLSVFYAESRFIADNVGDFSEDIRLRAVNFTNIFTRYFLFAVELQGIYRIGMTDFPISKQYRLNVRETLTSFAEFIVELIGLARGNRLPGTLTILDLDHIYRKLCYYVSQLSLIDDAPKPACDPTSPRIVSL
jgi:hypothetical protein